MERISFKQIKVFLDSSFMIQLFCCSTESWRHRKGKSGRGTAERNNPWECSPMHEENRKLIWNQQAFMWVYLDCYSVVRPVLSVSLGFNSGSHKSTRDHKAFILCASRMPWWAPICLLINSHTQKYSNTAFYSIIHQGKIRSESCYWPPQWTGKGWRLAFPDCFRLRDIWQVSMVGKKL